MWCVRAPHWWEPSSVFIGEREWSEEWERRVLSLLLTITFLRQLFPTKCERREGTLLSQYILHRKFWWHIEGMDVNVFMNTILLWNKSWWTVSLKYLQCREGEWEILSEQVPVRRSKKKWKKISKIFYMRIKAPFDVKLSIVSIKVKALSGGLFFIKQASGL